ncbi:hypothetical protein [Butyrivibrio sp. VCB2001]|uniref:hypothetical protein n=1 Tax=Butyrivibrio sp. VCB2001 TaxID=1280667 RepID=UPI0003FAAB49|nr:hypothetical protein [Butyrivibrio sp. VCB2001]
MKNTRMVKLLALGVSATLLLQPIAVFAEDNYNEPVVAAVENAEEKVEAALPSEEPVADEPVIIAQEPTDTHLENTEKALEKIDDTITAYNETLNDPAIAEADANYKAAVETAKESEGAFEQAAADAAADSLPAIIETGMDAYEAHQDANQVVQMSEEPYETQAEAEQAKAQATGIAAQAQAAADDAAAVVEELKGKVEAAEDAKDQADADFQAAAEAYADAVQARQEAEEEYDRIVRKYGLDSWFYNPDMPFELWGSYGKSDVRTAIVEAKAALESAKDAEEDAKDDYDGKKKEYDDAKDIYDQAVTDKEEAEKKLDDAIADLDRAGLIEAVNAVRAVEITTFNDNNGHHDDYHQNLINAADDQLAQSLIGYKLFDEGIKNYALEAVEGGYKVTYELNGETVTKFFGYSIDPETYTVGHGWNEHDSVHWLAINELKEESYTAYKDVFHDANTGEEVDGTGYKKWYGNTYYKIVRQGNQWVYVYATKTRVEYEATRLVTKTADYYKERTYYLDTKGFISKDAAQTVVNGLNEAIDKPGKLEDDLAQKFQDAEAAESAYTNAANKLDAVKEAHKAVIVAAKALKNLEAIEKASYVALTEVKKNYYNAVLQLEGAEFAYRWAAFNAGIAQYEADRALAALDEGFDYRIPTPTPTPGPSGEPTGDTTPSDTTDYIPVAPVAVTPAPAAPAPQQAVLGATRTRSGAAEAAVEAGEGEEEIKAAPAVEKKPEEKKEETKPAVVIKDEDTARAAAPISTKTPFPWWVLIILAAITAISIEEYVRRRNAKANAQG